MRYKTGESPACGKTQMAGHEGKGPRKLLIEFVYYHMLDFTKGKSIGSLGIYCLVLTFVLSSKA